MDDDFESDYNESDILEKVKDIDDLEEEIDERHDSSEGVTEEK